MIKRILSVFLTVVLAVSTASAYGFSASAETDKGIDNSSLLPKWVPDSQVTVDDNYTPDWADDLIMMEMRIQTATKEGTLESAVTVLDHFAEMGVNGIWITPVYDPGTTGNGYGNMGPQSIDPKITGTDDYKKGWKKLKEFIDEAHKRNIRIILDVISWGTVTESPLYTEHQRWFSGPSAYGGYSFNWNNEEFKEWYINEVVDIAVKTGCDGFRYDVEPNYAGYTVHTEIRERLLDKGRKILAIGEWMNERGGAYDMEQSSVGNFGEGYDSIIYNFLDNFNIVDSIKNGENIGSPTSQAMGFGADYKYYINCITNHDHYYPQAQGKRIVLGYQSILSPFIPMWYLGEEFNNSRDENLDSKGIVLYFNDIKWDELENEENKAYYEGIKSLIKIRRSYPEVFAYYPEHFRDTNICKVNVANCELTQPYARYADNKAFIVVPNNNIHNTDVEMTVYMPFVSTGLDYYKNYTVTDAETGEVIVKGTAADVAKFKVKVPKDDLKVYKVEASVKLKRPVEDEETEDSFDWNNGYENPEYVPVISDDTNVDSEEQQDQQQQYQTIITKRRKKKGSDFPIIPVVAGCVGGVVLIGGAVTFIIIKKKKSKK